MLSLRQALSAPLLLLGASLPPVGTTVAASTADADPSGPCQRCEISYSVIVLRGSAINCFQLVETGTTLDNSNANFLGQCFSDAPPCQRLTCSAITVSYDLTWLATPECAPAGSVTLVTRVDGDTARLIAGAGPVAIRISTRGSHCGYDSTRNFEAGAEYSKLVPITITSVLAQWEMISHCLGICPQ